MIRVSSRRGWLPGLAALAFWMTACAGRDPRLDSVASLPDEFKRLGLDPAAVVVPFEVSTEMRVWLRREVSNAGEADARLTGLLRALFDRSGLQLEYESDYSVTAREAFETHRANCLSFTNLFVGLAREMGLPAYFLEVDDVQRFTRDGDLVVVSGHVTAAYGPAQERVILDFTQGQAVNYREVREISDLRAIALYYSNRGAGELREGRHAEARRWLETAIVLDPELAGAWTNLGVAQRRTGDYAGAESSYRRALEADPRSASAYQNLGALLKMRGRTAESEQILELSRTLDSRNPFLYLDLGDVSLAQGRMEEAERYYRRALRLDDTLAESHAAMGLLFWRMGRPAEASRWLKRAEDRLNAGPRALPPGTPGRDRPAGSAGDAGDPIAARVTRLREALRSGGAPRAGS
jgi:tetratricopeptide (TPR) repeat protein